jgi:glycosyltransferase involved in cell wall biosynthesis
VNQAIGAGLPVICSDAVGAGYDLVEEEVNGLRFQAGDVGALTRCMERFVADAGLAARWGAASRVKAEAWVPDRGAAKWAEVFREVLGR